MALTEKTRDLTDLFTYKEKAMQPDGRFFPTHDRFMAAVDRVIARIFDGFGSSDLADTVFTHDAWEECISPAEVAQRILENDSIGSQVLADFFERLDELIEAKK